MLAQNPSDKELYTHTLIIFLANSTTPVESGKKKVKTTKYEITNLIVYLLTKLQPFL